MAKVTRNLLFIKDSGVLIGELPVDADNSAFNLDKFVVKPVEIDHEEGEYWYGDYTTGEIRARTDKPLITESFVKYNTNAEILNEYPLHKQLNILIDMLDKNATVKTDEFVAFKNYLDAARANHTEQVNAYASNPSAYTWISVEEEKAIIEKKQKFA
jgi:hypothetical protein